MYTCSLLGEQGQNPVCIHVACWGIRVRTLYVACWGSRVRTLYVYIYIYYIIYDLFGNQGQNPACSLLVAGTRVRTMHTTCSLLLAHILSMSVLPFAGVLAGAENDVRLISVCASK